MPILDNKQRKAVQDGIKACQACGETLKFMKALGIPTEAQEATNDFNHQVLTQALELEKQFDANQQGK